MSYRFSRRRTRVQQPPKVCKSKKKPPPTDDWPATIDVNLSWTALDMFMNFSSYGPTSLTANRVAATHDYTAADLDDQGNPFTVGVTVEKDPALITGGFDDPGSAVGAISATGTGPGWDPTFNPFASAITLTPSPPGLLWTTSMIVTITI